MQHALKETHLQHNGNYQHCVMQCRAKNKRNRSVVDWLDIIACNVIPRRGMATDAAVREG